MNRRIDIHNFNSRLSPAERLVKLANPIIIKNSKLISQFENYCFSTGLSKGRITKYVYTLRKIAKCLGKNFDEVNRKDIEELINNLERSDYSAWTKHDYKVIIKRSKFTVYSYFI